MRMKENEKLVKTAPLYQTSKYRKIMLLTAILLLGVLDVCTGERLSGK